MKKHWKTWDTFLIAFQAYTKKRPGATKQPQMTTKNMTKEPFKKSSIERPGATKQPQMTTKT